MDLKFGGHVLKVRERQLLGPEGLIDISARAFDILGLLLSKPGDIISKDDLFAAVWPGVVVEENTLQVHISALRKALGPSFIVTVHGRGYKYAGPEPLPAGGGNTALPGHSDAKPVIVVLPLDNLSGDPDQQYFSDGIAGDITDRLTRFRRFTVIGQHSAARFRAQSPDFAAIREKLKADFVLTGSVRRAGGRVRIAPRLSSAISEEAIWAERYDRPMTDLFDLQDEISELVAAAVARHLEIEINVQSTRKPHVNLTSHEHVLQGYWHFRKLTKAANAEAQLSFGRAIAHDPSNAEAVAWLGVTHCEAWVQDFDVDHASMGATLTARAMVLDPVNAMCHATHTWALLCIGDLDAALHTSARGLSLNAGEPGMLVNRALALTYDGRYAEARAYHEQALRLEPLPPPWFAEFAGVLAFAEGRYQEALDCLLPFEDFAWDAMYALASYVQMGEADRAGDMVSRFRQQGREPDWQLGLSREPYRDAGVRERLAAGLVAALSP